MNVGKDVCSKRDLTGYDDLIIGGYVEG